MVGKSIRELVEEAIDAFDDPTTSVTSHVRRAIRIASKRQDYVALIRFLPETWDFGTGKQRHAGFEEARASLVALIGPEEAERQEFDAIQRHMQARRMDKNNVYGQSIGQLEAMLAQVNEIVEGYKKPPENLTPIDTYFVAREYDAATAKVLPARRQIEDAIERVKQSVHDFLIETERQLELGQPRPHIFERGREYLEQALQLRAPEALEKFRAAEDAIASGEPEDLAHALTSCRRMIKALADALYPATDETIVGIDGRTREMTSDAYRNRLLQFAIERLGHSTHGDMIKETLRSLGGRLERLVELSSKGVHDEVSRVEAETCLMWTYLTAADFLRIADGTALGVEPTSAQAQASLSEQTTP